MVLVASAAWGAVGFTLAAQYPSTQQLYGQQGNAPIATLTMTNPTGLFTWQTGSLPTGITVAFSPTTCVIACTVTATFTVTGSAVIGGHTISIQGTDTSGS